MGTDIQETNYKRVDSSRDHERLQSGYKSSALRQRPEGKVVGRTYSMNRGALLTKIKWVCKD